MLKHIALVLQAEQNQGKINRAIIRTICVCDAKTGTFRIKVGVKVTRSSTLVSTERASLVEYNRVPKKCI